MWKLSGHWMMGEEDNHLSTFSIGTRLSDDFPICRSYCTVVPPTSFFYNREEKPMESNKIWNQRPESDISTVMGTTRGTWRPGYFVVINWLYCCSLRGKLNALTIAIPPFILSNSRYRVVMVVSLLSTKANAVLVGAAVTKRNRLLVESFKELAPSITIY